MCVECMAAVHANGALCGGDCGAELFGTGRWKAMYRAARGTQVQAWPSAFVAYYTRDHAWYLVRCVMGKGAFDPRSPTT